MKKMTEKDVLNNLKKLVGKEFESYDDIYDAFGDFEQEDDEEYVYCGQYDYNKYIAYRDKENSTQFIIIVDKVEVDDGEFDEYIQDVYICR